MNTTIELVVTWIFIGLGTSLAAMMWPFRRGIIGVVLNVVAGVSGALLGGLIALVTELHKRPGASFFLAFLGAVTFVLGFHYVLTRRLHAPR